MSQQQLWPWLRLLLPRGITAIVMETGTVMAMEVTVMAVTEAMDTDMADMVTMDTAVTAAMDITATGMDMVTITATAARRSISLASDMYSFAGKHVCCRLGAATEF